MNLYITTSTQLPPGFGNWPEAYRRGVKTVYYIRSKALEVEECESCST